MSEELRSAYMKLTKRGQNTRRMFFRDHNDAFDTAKTFQAQGWHWEIRVIEVYETGQRPVPTQERLL